MFKGNAEKGKMMLKRTGVVLLAVLLAAMTMIGCGKKGNVEESASGNEIVIHEDVKAEYVLIDQVVNLEKDSKLRVSPSNEGTVAVELPAGQAIDWVAYGSAWSIVEYDGEVYYTSTGSLPVKSVSLEGKRKVTGSEAVAVETSASDTVSATEEETEEVGAVDGTVDSTEELESVVSETVMAVEEDGQPVQGKQPEETMSEAQLPEASVPAVSGTTAVALQPYSIGTFDLSALPNDSMNSGYSTDDRDASNRPNGCLYLQHIYGNKYGADFIVENPGAQTIYLTMDEGYEAGYTPVILDTLAEKGVKVVFFVTKQFVSEHPELVQRMINEGHIIGNHTCAHPAAGMPSFGVDGETNDIMTLHNLIQEQFGYTMNLFRYPSGIFSEQSLALLHNLGYRPVFWSFAHRDWVITEQPDPAASLDSMINQLHPGAIYLLHAVSATNTQVLGQFIDEARARGYEFGVYE